MSTKPIFKTINYFSQSQRKQFTGSNFSKGVSQDSNAAACPSYKENCPDEMNWETVD